jgi:hypothetical protein
MLKFSRIASKQIIPRHARTWMVGYTVLGWYDDQFDIHPSLTIEYRWNRKVSLGHTVPRPRFSVCGNGKRLVYPVPTVSKASL